MAQLKDTVISGSLRVTDTTYTTTADVSFIKVSTAAGAAAHGTGTAGQALFSNGASAAYWGSTAHQHNYLPATSTDTSLKIESNILKHKTTITATANISGSAAASPAFGGTFAVPYFSIDGFGHSTAVGAKTITIPNSVYTTASATTNGAIGLVPAPTSGQQDFILSAGKKWVSSAHTHNYLPATTVDASLKIESNTLKHATTLTASASISGTSNVSGWGQTATVAVPSIDAYGHTTAWATKTITMPSSTGLSTTDEKLKMTPASVTKFYPAGNPNSTSAVTTAYYSTAVSITGATVSGGTFSGNMIHANVANSGSAGGVALYSTVVTDYGVAMRQTANSGKHGGVQGDWAIYTCMAGATNRGWIFKNSATAVASIDCTGSEVLNGSLTVGGSSANNTGVQLSFNKTTKSLDFIFVS